MDVDPTAPDRLPVVGMVGAGQLARMTQQAAIALGQSLRVLAAAPDDPAARVCADVVPGAPDDLAALRALADGADALTFDHEGVPLELLRALVADGVAVHPGPDALVHAQDKLVMRRALAGLAGSPGSECRSTRRSPIMPTSRSWPRAPGGPWCSRRSAAVTTGAGCGCSTGPLPLSSRSCSAPGRR